MKTYYLTLSQVFPVTHFKAGEPTGFKEKVEAAIKQLEGEWWKLHTIRANCALWAKRFEKIATGEACLSIRMWTGKPYRSKQVEIVRLTREDGIGLQKLSFDKDRDGCISYKFFNIDGRFADIQDVAKNDGLSFNDWREWFKGCDLSQPLAIIHFTAFRY